MAALMAINSLGMDLMLAALPQMSETLHIARENDRQWIIGAYMLAFGAGQIFYGPLADRFGRKPILLGSLAVFSVASIAAAFADSFATMIAARLVQGFSVASSRVLNISIIRDCYSGRQMARVISLSFIVFQLVPLLAPGMGQLILLFAPWPAIFLVLAACSTALVGWLAWRLPETLHPEHRRPIDLAAIVSAAAEAMTNRHAIGYTVSVALMFGAMMGFINSAQQLFFDTFQVPQFFAIAFAGVSIFMAVAAFTNSRIVDRLGTHFVSHVALIAFVVLSGLHLLIVSIGLQTFWSFMLLQGTTAFCFSLAAPNFGAMAIQPMGHIAGTAASIQSFITTVGATLLGLLIGLNFDGTSRPLVAGFFILGLAALAVVFVTERGRLCLVPENDETQIDDENWIADGSSSSRKGHVSTAMRE